MRLRLRLIAGFVTVHVLLSAGAGVVAWQWLDHVQRAQAEQSARSVGTVIAGGGFSLSPRVIERMRTLTGYEFRVLTSPEQIRAGTVQVGEGDFIVEIDYRTDAWAEASQSVLWATIWWSFGGSAAFALVAIYVAGQFARPVEQLAASARAIGTGTWDQAVPNVGSGEVAELARDLDGMRQRLTALDQAHRHAERLATLGTFTATIAHEVRNPLSAVRLTVQLLAKKHPGDQGLTLITDEIERLDLIVDELLSFSRGLTVRLESCDLLNLVSQIIHLLQRQADHAGVVLQVVNVTTTMSNGLVQADPLRIRQLLLNLLLNAIQSAQHAQENPLVRIDVHDRGLSVSDNGPGVPPELEAHLFEAFRTSRSDGTGLGLHLARAIADAHQATLRYERCAPGARFILEGLQR